MYVCIVCICICRVQTETVVNIVGQGSYQYRYQTYPSHFLSPTCGVRNKYHNRYTYIVCLSYLLWRWNMTKKNTHSSSVCFYVSMRLIAPRVFPVFADRGVNSRYQLLWFRKVGGTQLNVRPRANKWKTIKCSM